MFVTIYSKPDCHNCNLTKRDMDILGIEYQVIDVSEDTEQVQRLLSLGFKSLPVVKSNQGVWAGYDQEKIKSLVTF